ncbi:hypothetical protein M8445_17325 (plasmid) [Deinococcus aquaticus]|uniref:Uncharacterized protein n=1 Tax=Deinococcus aquaticus TaxID=328692 RepID=A0ABY7V7Q2_9DEIO|nr:hypothetical protein [Deinococcus aquaticus]WDA60729.1 hypothetical protein M8445_17325 [Deinococcus aquaticus]
MSAFHVLLHYIPAALRAERAPLAVEQLPGRLAAGPIRSSALRRAVDMLRAHQVIRRVPVTPLIRAELTRQGVERLPLHAYELTSNPRGREFTAWLDDIAAPRHRTGVALRRSA